MLNKNLSQFILLIIIFAAVLIADRYIYAWTEPTVSPPDANTASPLNVSSIYQTKSGALIVNTGGATNGFVVANGRTGLGNVSPSYTLDVTGDINVAAANVYRRGGTAGASVTCGANTAPSNITISGGIITSAGACTAFGGGTVGGSGTDNYIPRWNGTSALENSVIYQLDSGNVGIGTAGPGQKLQVSTNEVSTAFKGIMVENLAGGNSDASRAGIAFKAYDWVQSAIWHGRNISGANGGALVFGTNPNTSDLTVGGVVGRMVITNGGNVGIGTASPGSKLVIYNAAESYGISLNPASAAAGLGFNRNATDGTIYNTGASAWQLSARDSMFTLEGYNGAATNPWTVLKNGNVGIGTASPTQKLTLEGTAPIAEIRSGGYLMLRPTANDYDWRLQAVAYRLDFLAGGDLANPRMTILSSGQVGIGTAAPGYKLDVRGAAGTWASFGDGTSAIRISGDGTGGWAKISSPNRIYLDSAAGTVMTITNGGNVGIGTASPTQKLTLEGTAPIAEIRSGGYLMLRPTANDYDWRLQAVAYRLDFLAGGDLANPRMTILSSGQVGIGETAPSNRLRVVDNSGNSIAYFTQNGAGDLLVLWAGSTERFRVTNSGYVNAYAFTYISDRSLKQDIKKLDDSLGKINLLEGVSFKWKESGLPAIGVVAQDVEKVYPEAVYTDKTTGLKSVNYGVLVAPLIEAVKEQQKTIDGQQKQIDELRAEIEVLKNR